MRTRRCIRYLCDHCSKGMFSRPAMERHEKRCFHNPNRTECGGCSFDGGISVTDHSIEEMIAAIIDEKQGIAAALKLAEGCPACVCSALIQARKRAKKDGDLSLESYLWTDVEFDYKKSMDAFRTEVMNSRPEDFYL